MCVSPCRLRTNLPIFTKLCMGFYAIRGHPNNELFKFTTVVNMNVADVRNHSYEVGGTVAVHNAGALT
jgi:hypothetical protein